MDTSIKRTLNVLQAVPDLGLSREVHGSTSEVYGRARSVPMTEAHPLQGESPYSASTIGADQIAPSFHASFKTAEVALRPFNMYGPRESARAVIPLVIVQIASGRRRIRLGALHPTRDFSFVTDTVAGFIASLKADRVVGEVINLASGFGISVDDTAQAVAAATGIPLVVSAEIGESDRVVGSGRVYRENSVEDLAHVLPRLARADERKALGAAGRAKMEERYNRAEIAGAIEGDFTSARGSR